MWGDEAFPDNLPLCHHGVDEVHTGEGGNDLLRLYPCHPQPIKERCHPLFHPHRIGLCMHHMTRGCRRQDWGYHQRVNQGEGFKGRPWYRDPLQPRGVRG